MNIMSISYLALFLDVPLSAPSHTPQNQILTIQFTYLTILAAAAGVKAAALSSPCIYLCYDVKASADCGAYYKPVWDSSRDCYICCGVF
ncbi:hypothetical protein EDB19DRAFT_813103 [Suillus lakei]|nr:hypothetical protein EDB19DRAFT_813103 [Suillus lakei]